MRCRDEGIALFGIVIEPERFAVPLDRAAGGRMRGDILDKLIEFIDVGRIPLSELIYCS